jgi:hypothetical protein
MRITATKTYSPTHAITSFECFTFDDGATIRVSGGLICSKHGRHHCAHHKLAHEAIVTAAAQHAAARPPAEEAATDAALEAADAFNADYDAWLDSLPASQPHISRTPAYECVVHLPRDTERKN